MNTANLLLKELTGQSIPMGDFLPAQKFRKEAAKSTVQDQDESGSTKNAVEETVNRVVSTKHVKDGEDIPNENLEKVRFKIKSFLRSLRAHFVVISL